MFKLFRNFKASSNLWIVEKQLQFPKQFVSTKTPQPQTSEQDEASAIEANMFDNSSHVHKPAVKDELLMKRRAPKEQKPKIKLPPANKEKPTLTRLIKDADLGLEFYRLQLHDPLIAKLMTEVRSRKRYSSPSTIAIEGTKLIQEALENNLQIQTLIFSQKEELQKISSTLQQLQQKQQERLKIYKVPQHDLKIWSTLTTPPGLLAIFQRPSNDHIQSYNSLPITVICDNIREPNNLGSIIRTCAALPCNQVLITRGCCDPWESKALRGGCGGHFRLRICDGLTWSEIHELYQEVSKDVAIFIAENNMEKLKTSALDSIEYCHVSNMAEHNLVIIGGETHGVSEDAYSFTNSFEGSQRKCLHIPLAQGVDSLNVVSALTLILFELRKQLFTTTT